MKSLVHTEELCSPMVPMEYAPGAKPVVCIGLHSFKLEKNTKSKILKMNIFLLWKK